MSRKSNHLWEAMKAGKFWHDTDKAKAEPVKEKPEQNLSAKEDKPQPKKAKPPKAKPKKKTEAKPQPTEPVERPEEEKKIDIPFNNPARPSQTSVGSKPGRKIATKGKVLDLDLWEGDTTEIYPKITVMPHGLRLIGTHEEFMRLANRLLSS